jgi:hypothetical protein
MDKNKGVIGIGLILAIVLGIVVVGGGAYYLGKDSNKVEIKNPVNVLPNVEKQELPVKEEEKKETPPKVVSDCDSNSKPSIKVLSPKGGEVYKVGDKITVKWSSCNVQKVYVSMAQGGHDMGNLTETSILASQGSYQWIVPSTQWESNTGFIFGIWDADPGHTDIVGKSGSFSVASATGMPDPKTLIKDVSTVNWKTYTNTEYGLSFIYPSSWKLSEDKSKKEVTVSTNDTDGVDVTFPSWKISFKTTDKSYFNSNRVSTKWGIITYNEETKSLFSDGCLKSESLSPTIQTIRFGGSLMSDPAYSESAILTTNGNIIVVRSEQGAGLYPELESQLSIINHSFKLLNGNKVFVPECSK